MLNSRKKNDQRSLESRESVLHPTSPCHRPPPTPLTPAADHPLPPLEPASRKQTDRPLPPGAFFAAWNTRLRGVEARRIYMRATEQKNGREFVLQATGGGRREAGRDGRTEETEGGGAGRGVFGVCVRNLVSREPRRLSRAIGHSLFLRPDYTRSIYRVHSIDYTGPPFFTLVWLLLIF